jgi:integrase
MARAAEPRKRKRGSISALPSGALRVRVYAGRDPVSKRELYLDEVVPPGPRQAREAEQHRTRLLNLVDEKRNPRTRATVAQLMTKYFEVHDVDPSTLRGNKSKYENHIKPLLGDVQLARLDAEILESFYAQLKVCRAHCGGRRYVEHRTKVEHRCDEHRGAPCSPPRPLGCRACRRMCRPHVCEGLSASSIRAIHWLLSGALQRAVVWKWISVNPAENAAKPSLPTPEPSAPTPEEMATLIIEAWKDDPDWARFLWVKATTGARRGEMCGLRQADRRQVDGDSVLTIARSIYVAAGNKLVVKDTKTHQQRLLVLDPETDFVFDEIEQLAVERLAAVGEERAKSAYIFSPVPDGSLPHHPDLLTRRFTRLARRLGIDASLKHLRHYNATELLAANHNVKIVGGRLGHGGGGTTTLKVYAVYRDQADQRAAGIITPRMPPRPGRHMGDRARMPTDNDNQETVAGAVGPPREQYNSPYSRIAADLRGAIDSGILRPGDTLPAVKELANRYGVSASTAHRAIVLLSNLKLVVICTGKPTRVAHRK